MQARVSARVDRIQECRPPFYHGGRPRPGTGDDRAGVWGSCESQDEAELPSATVSTTQCFLFAGKSGLLTSWSEDGKNDIGPTGLSLHPRKSLSGYRLDSALTLRVL